MNTLKEKAEQTEVKEAWPASRPLFDSRDISRSAEMSLIAAISSCSVLISAIHGLPDVASRVEDGAKVVILLKVSIIVGIISPLIYVLTTSLLLANEIIIRNKRTVCTLIHWGASEEFVSGEVLSFMGRSIFGAARKAMFAEFLIYVVIVALFSPFYDATVIDYVSVILHLAGSTIVLFVVSILAAAIKLPDAINALPDLYDLTE